MKHLRSSALVLVIFCCAVSGASVHSPSPPSSAHQRKTWYEFVVRQFNPSGFDYGAWIDRRRHSFLDATVGAPYFWYSCSVTATLLLLFIAHAKLRIDYRRTLWITADAMADLYNHDSYSRAIAKAAIEKYNRHIEQCNRVIEQRESAEGRIGWGDEHSEAVKAELQRVASQLEATTQDRDKLQEELRRKSLVIADLTTRIDALAKKMGGREVGLDNTRVGHASPDGAVPDVKLIDQVNRLQEDLYGERQKNKRLKGA
jgi:hypothetical protein